MIKEIDNSQQAVADTIYQIFQMSYRKEAEILGMGEEFPPLKRPVEDFMACDSVFYAYYKDAQPAALVELKHSEGITDVQSLVVHPKFFRQGIGRQLMSFVINNMGAELYKVETGLDNLPATSLYKQLGFDEVGQYDTPFGVRKVMFELHK